MSVASIVVGALLALWALELVWFAVTYRKTARG
jgi:hypothetical protein